MMNVNVATTGKFLAQVGWLSVSLVVLILHLLHKRNELLPYHVKSTTNIRMGTVIIAIIIR